MGLELQAPGTARFWLGGATTIDWLWFASNVLFTLAAWSLALGYGAGIVLLIQREFWKKCLAPLPAIGRMALTNYLLQTLICTTLFNAYGLGLYGKVGPAAVALLAMAIYLFQVVLSFQWARHFRFGPAEWLWEKRNLWPAAADADHLDLQSKMSFPIVAEIQDRTSR